MDPVTILIVDDDEVLAQVLQRVLTRQGHTVLHAGTVAQARQMAREHTPQLGLLDLSLPDGDGVELADQFDADGLHFPLILITAYPLRLREHPELSSKFVRVLTKPLNLQELRQAVEAALGGTTTAPTPPAVPAPVPPVLPAPAPHLPEAPVSSTPAPASRRLLWAGVGLAVVLLLVGALVAGPAIGLPNVAAVFKGKDEKANYDPTKPTVEEPRLNAQLVEGAPNTIEVPPDVVKRLGIETRPVEEAHWLQPLELAGSLALDPDRMAVVRTRFPGEVVKIGSQLKPGPSGVSEYEPLSFGDHVHEGDLLFVVYSKDLGDKKSDLRDALSQLDYDQGLLDRQEELWKEGATTENAVRTAKRAVEADKILVERAKSTLRAWRLTEKEIDDIVKQSLEFIKRNKDPKTRTVATGINPENWASVEVRVPNPGLDVTGGKGNGKWEGTILEKNVTRGTMVDPSVDLFKIADLRRLIVWANVYEEDLGVLQRLKEEADAEHRPLTWTVHLKSDPDAPSMSGQLSKIGQIVDPTQHSALVMGWVDNPQERLRSGQFATVSVERPAPPNTVYVPAAAVLEDGQDSFILVKLSDDPARYALKRALVARRYSDRFLLYRDPNLAGVAAGPGWRALNLSPMNPGDQVVVRSNLELRAALKDLQDKKEGEKDTSGK